MARMLARVIKVEGDSNAATALALAAVAPELAALRAENAQYRKESEERKKRRWRENAAKLTAYKENIKPVPTQDFAIAVCYSALRAFVRLFIVREGNKE